MIEPGNKWTTLENIKQIMRYIFHVCVSQEKFEDSKRLTRSRKSKDRQYNVQKEERTERQTMTYKTKHYMDNYILSNMNHT
jgi:hypothetical protein